jgi:two-component system cell cycle sensor histidine kinase/response regulator CckA
MNKPRIIVVEDEKVVAADIEACVKGLGYEVVGAAATGTDALRLAVKTMPDLALMDIKLKGVLDGIEVAGALYDQLKIPVVYLTAHADAEILQRARQTTPAGYVIKPFDDRTLRTAIELAFDRHRRERQLIDGGQRMAAAIGSIDEAVIVAGGDGHITLMNPVAETLTGWTQPEALGKPVGEVFVVLNPLTGAPQASPVARVLQDGLAIGLGDGLVLLGRQGARHIVQGSVTPVRDAGTHALGVCLLFRAAGQSAADEPWGSPDHGAASHLQVLGRLSAAVAQKISQLLQAGRGRSQAARLANRLLEFSRRQPAAPADVDLNELISGLDDLLQCALGDGIALQLVLSPGAGAAKADPGRIELILVQLALSAGEAALSGQFTIQTSSVSSEDTGDACAIVTVTPPYVAPDFPTLDEIVRQSPGEIRLSVEDGAVEIYLPASVIAGSPT